MNLKEDLDMKYYNITKTTTSSRNYKLAKKRIIERLGNRCFHCGPYSGCNWWRTNHRATRSWKNYRKTQYKGIIK